MAYGYFNADGSLLTISAKQTDYQDENIIEMEVAELMMANSIYLDIESMTVQQKMPYDLTIEYNRVSGIPVGTTVVMPEGIHVVDDGEIEFEADTPEVVNLILNHPHYQEQFIEVMTGPETV